jgi:hypothetical protein
VSEDNSKQQGFGGPGSEDPGKVSPGRNGPGSVTRRIHVPGSVRIPITVYEMRFLKRLMKLCRNNFR